MKTYHNFINLYVVSIAIVLSSIVCGIAFAVDSAGMPQKHLSSSLFSTGSAYIAMTPGERFGGSMIWKVSPKPGNTEWTSIKSCLGAWPDGKVSQKVKLTNLDTNEVYYYQTNTVNSNCHTQVFDVPIHTFHNLQLEQKCYHSKSDVEESCKGTVILYSSVEN